MKLYENFEKGTPEYVYYHGLYQIEMGEKPSALLSVYYCISKNTEEVFNLAKSIVKDCSIEEKTDTILGRPFLRTEIDWEKKYQQHLEGPSSKIPFSPIYGIDKCTCSQCFYRDAPEKSNPKKDCQIGEKGDLAKKFFGIASKEFLPEVIEGKEVAHYCPYWLIFTAE